MKLIKLAGVYLHMHCTLTLVRYPAGMGWAGFISMAWFRFPLWFSNKRLFWKLMGCGKNGTFDIQPDWRQWSVLLVSDQEKQSEPPKFMQNWWKWMKAEVCILHLQPIEGHGTWDGKACMGEIPKDSGYDGIVAVLTRATIRLNRLKHFWKHVDAVASQMAGSEGFITSVGIGEVPWIKQATFSIWRNKASMKAFAYRRVEHKEVIKKTYQEKWYSEEMFVRFIPIKVTGSLESHPGWNMTVIEKIFTKN